MGDGQESRIFVSYRALGLVCSAVPAVLRYVVQARRIKLHTSVGNVIHTFRCPKMTLESVSEPLPAEVSCLAADDYCVYAACDCSIVVLRRGRDVKFTLYGHASPVCLLLPFGAHLISIDERSNVIVWNLRSRKIYSELCVEASLFGITAVCHPVTYVNKVLFGSEQGSLKLFNLKRNNLVHEFSGWGCPVTALQQSPAIDVVAIGLLDGRIQIHNLRYDETLITFRHEGGPVRSLAFRTDGPAVMISGNDRGELALWDLEKHQLAMLKEAAHEGAVVTLISIQNEPCIVTTGTDNAIKCWLFDTTLGSLRLFSRNEGHSLPPIWIQFHGYDGRTILSAGGDGKLKIFDTISDSKNANLGTAAVMRRSEARRRGKDFEKLRLPPVVCFASSTARENAWDNVVCCHENHPMATTWTSRRCRIGSHKMYHPRFRTDPDLRRSKATCCAVSNCGNYALIGYSSGHVDVYNAQSAIHRGSLQDESLPAADRAHSLPVQGICLNSLTQLIVTGCTEGKLKLWHFRTKKLLYTHSLEAGIKRLIINQDNDLLAAALDNLSLIVYDIFYRRVTRRFDYSHAAGITDLTFSPTGHWLLSSSQDCTVKVWDLPTSTLVDVLSFTHACKSLSMSPTGEYLATCHSERRGVYLWVNKTLYRPQLTLRPLSANYEPTGCMDLPVTLADVANDSLSEVEPLDTDSTKDDDSYVSPEQIEQLCSLSSLPPSRWAHLIDLDIIRRRNKPKEPPRKAIALPFFLTSLSSTAPKDESRGVGVPGDAKNQSSRILSFGQLGSKSDFCKQLQSCESEADYWLAFETLKSYGPAVVHSEIMALEPTESTDPLRSIHRFLHMVLVVLRSGRCFEVVNSYLALFLQVHRELMWRSSEQFADQLRQVEIAQADTWRRLDELVTETISMVSFMNATLV